jgi:serine/threonine protein kinase
VDFCKDEGKMEMEEKKLNCWEYLKCGREPGGKNVKELGLCPAATDTSFDGINSGKNAGRIGWAVAGTCREGEVYGTYAQKRASCVGCEFYKLVQEEEGTSKEANNLLGLFTYNEDSPLLKELTVKVVKAGKRLINQGEVQDQAYIIQSGSCLVIVEKDGQLYPVDHRGRGDIVGISSLLTGETQRAHVEAESDMELWVMSRALFEDISRVSPELLDFLTELVASRFDSRRPVADRVIDKYIATDIIGRGSHSIVYRGMNRSLDMPVAIKMLRHHRAIIPEFSERFRDEAKTIARLNHENIVKVYDVEEIYKTIFIIMEYLDGMTLDRVLEKTPRVPFAQILDILLQVCSGLAYAHEYGILHQDIRPGNIFVQLDGKIKIVDFGLACHPGDVDDLYWPGATLYSSPEYIEGNPVDGRSDIYSLGITTFEMIAGKKPFPEDDPAKAIQFHLEGEFPDLRDFVPDVPEELRKFVLMTCRRDPAERYQNLYQAVEDLRSLADVLDLKSKVALSEKRKMGAVFLGQSDCLSPDPIERKVSKGFVTEGSRVLATILITDIVGSTEKAVELGDSLWGNLVEHHHTLVRREIAKFQGNEVETTGDGFVATFDNAADAIQCACAISHTVQSLGIKIRAGLHFGECEVVDGVLHGITVHIGSRVAAKAKPSEVLVSSVVKNAVAGTEIEFVDRGPHILKGVPGEWHLFAVE